jgi:uncharacterized protein YciI/heme-degrading monooxygenase HmoA
MHYLLFYEVGDDYLARRGEFRDAHLEKAWAASERGELMLGGALSDPVDGAVLLFRGDSSAVAERFARVDPYVTSGLVKRWHVREWKTVAGEGSATPVRPQGKTAVAVKEIDLPQNDRPQNKDNEPILRMWRAQSSLENSDKYVEFVTQKIFPKLAAIEGHRGAYLLRRVMDGSVKVVVLTLWESMDAVRRFAGAMPDNAVVEAKTQAVLSSFDDFVTHYDVVYTNVQKTT